MNESASVLNSQTNKPARLQVSEEFPLILYSEFGQLNMLQHEEKNSTQ